MDEVGQPPPKKKCENQEKEAKAKSTPAKQFRKVKPRKMKNTAAKNENKWEEEEEKKKENNLVKSVVTNLGSLKAPIQEGSDSL